MNWGSDFFFGIIFIYFIFSIGRLGFWNLKIYEWIGRYTNELGFGFFFGRYTNELEDIRMNWGSDFFSRENIRMNWKIYAWIGVQIFFGIINNIYFIFCIGGLGCWNLKIYEWIGRYTNELGFRFFFGRYTNELEDIYEWIVVQIFFRRGKSSNSFVHLPKKNLNPNSFVYLPIHSYIFPPKNLNHNSFVYLPIHSYIFQKIIWTTIYSYIFQFIRISSKKKIWTPIHSYIFQFIRIFSHPKKNLNPSSFVYLPIHSYIFQKKIRTPIHSYIFQFIRISSDFKTLIVQY